MSNVLHAKTEDGRRVILHPNGQWQLSPQHDRLPSGPEGTPQSPSKSGAQGGQPDVRQVCWGMTKGQVRSVEDAQEIPSSVEHMLTYQGTVTGLEAFIAYEFVGEKLGRLIYSFQHKHSYSNKYLEDYERIKDILTKKYGAPEKDDVLWNKLLYRNDIEQYGMAVECGHLSLTTAWENERTRAQLLLTGDNFEVSLGLMYLSKQLAADLEAQTNSGITDDL